MSNSLLVDEIVLDLASKLDYLHLAARFSREICHSIGHDKIDEKFIDDVELVVSEACTNVIRHAGMDDSGRLVLVFQIYQDRLAIEVKDQGEGFDITKVPDPNFDEFAEGGYGIYIIRTKMDSIEYQTVGEWNILSMTKRYNERIEKRGSEV